MAEKKSAKKPPSGKRTALPRRRKYLRREDPRRLEYFRYVGDMCDLLPEVVHAIGPDIAVGLTDESTVDEAIEQILDITEKFALARQNREDAKRKELGITFDAKVRR